MTKLVGVQDCTSHFLEDEAKKKKEKEEAEERGKREETRQCTVFSYILEHEHRNEIDKKRKFIV